MDSPKAPNNELDDGAPIDPQVSVVICTFNRMKALERAITSVLDQAVPECQFEIIVVDNNSTDETAAVVKGFTTNHPNVRYVFEPEQGLSFARNTGWRSARAPYVAFVDDDAVAQPAWLKTILEALEACAVPPSGIAGPIVPFYTSEKPAWFSDRWETRTWGSTTRFLTTAEYPSGSNMVIARSVLEALEGFDTALGMHGANIGLGEETDLFMRLGVKYGERQVFYAPESVVAHEVPSIKLTVRYRLRRSYMGGKAFSFCGKSTRLDRRLLSAMVQTGKLALAIARALLHITRHSDPRTWMVEELGSASRAAGRICACLRPIR